MNKLKNTLKKWNSIFCSGMTCKSNIGRDIVVLFLLILVAAVFLYSTVYTPMQAERKPAVQAGISGGPESVVPQKETSAPIMSEDNISKEVENIINTIDSSNWKKTNNQFWGFSVKYPGGWLSPKSQRKPAGSKWEARYQFRKKDAGGNPFLGFDVAVYDVPKTKELRNTEEYPVPKNDKPDANSQCQNIEGHAIEIDDFPAEEIYIPLGDDCYNAALFFSIVKDRYIYNIVPVLEAGAERGTDPRLAVNDNFPDYYAAASTLVLIDIVRPKPAPPKPKITAPKPVSYKVVGGRLVCAKKNDKPRKSRQNKGKHLDMECCLDPDEYPNPWCTY
ncbi:MAG: hypothetical protein A2359_03445 [Candidatus Moranbacteria bacterium RIFOXYB1_FULL_43_19]|nr:MAG: hypothetical protein A2359_03445 [Candidatus Moranbacteria bacterium RIFOXYB1_FULL_43_19]OGI27918.1 MAG: hypothetical protein A2184_02795 [Candidatus Moranbacteria bacterium RIFOXYA1_FULL_44_7]OGI32534.1 MAG: hypothetical protein A2420_03090 [Candidatus Moranbacteria bacterium RIFOXYC1_FULL_44_13]OGI38156.1 MAG: hypothetical protein A2612_01380 [Candidatus Moranbacteria bacterium RIFOXYD1_FULL_44_12]